MVRKTFALILMLVAVSACEDDKLVHVDSCNLPCSPPGYPAWERGECHLGKLQCYEDGGSTCVGYKGPKAEACDGLDNNCDGNVDENMIEVCSGACGAGTKICQDGAWGACRMMPPTPEVCNGLDDDCDGKIDEPEDMPLTLCYTGPANTVTNGICHPGATRCVAARDICFGQQLPETEVCDGIDNDCDGVIDNGFDTNIDVVLVFDNSGSMDQIAAAVKAAVRTWVTKYAGFTGRRYALVTAPDMDYLSWQSRPHLFQDFTDAPQFSAAMALQNGSTGSGLEPTLDALDDIFSVNNPLRMSWRPGVKRLVIVFSDEEPQSGRNPALTTAMLLPELTGRGITVESFTSQYIADAVTLWGQIAGGAGGRVPPWEIYTTAQNIEDNLDVIIRREVCQP